MHRILCDGERFGNFDNEASAEAWLRDNGWEKQIHGRWAYFQGGKYTLWAEVQEDAIPRTIVALEAKMRE